MFRGEGQERSDRQNRLVAGYLAAIAGFVNSAGFIVIGSFTSHVTGNVGRLADDVALGRPHAAAFAAILISSFFAGAFVASMALESRLIERRAVVYALLLSGEAALLVAFTLVYAAVSPTAPRVKDAAAAMLCLAMGMQNSLVTRLSGAIVRTTHLTGVVTDLGIESARWFRYWRSAIAAARGVRLTLAAHPAERPHRPKFALLATIFGSFVGGAAGGALVVEQVGADAMWIPAAALLAAALVALARR